MALERGVAALGLADKLNGGAAVLSAGWHGTDFVVELADGGEFLAYCEREPSRVELDGQATSASFRDGRLTLRVTAAGRQQLRLGFDAESPPEP